MKGDSSVVITQILWHSLVHFEDHCLSIARDSLSTRTEWVYPQSPHWPHSVRLTVYRWNNSARVYHGIRYVASVYPNTYGFHTKKLLEHIERK